MSLLPALPDEDGELPEADGVLDEDGEEELELDGELLDGELLEPLAALPLGVDDGLLDELELDAPPEAGELGVALDDELELLSVDDEPNEPEAEPDVEPEGVDDGEEVAPEDEVELGDLAPGAEPSRSQAVSRLAPSAMDTAAARIESLMWPPWLGYHRLQQGSGQHLYECRRCQCPDCKFFPPRWSAVIHSQIG